MHSIEQLLQMANPVDALSQLQGQVKKSPADAKLRTLLFQLLAVLGQWERALVQLNVAGELAAANLAMVQTYREVINCEMLRKAVFNGHKSPLVFGEPEPWIALLQESVKLNAENLFAESTRLRDQAFDSAPITNGIINGSSFEWIADADTRLGPVLEAIVNGRYYWVPFSYISEIHIEEPADLRDLVWMPAHFVWANKGETVGFIPSRYPYSEDSPDALIQLARKTEWQEISENSYTGLGQRMLTTDKDDYPLFDIREIKFTPGTK